jgi:hypothetical protein
MNKLIKQSQAQIQLITQDWDHNERGDERRIIEGHYDRKISTFYGAEDKNERFQELHRLMVKWAVLCGVRPLPDVDEMELFVKYIAQNFYRFSLMEISNAFNLATSGKLSVNAEHYQSFSVIYISKILNAYKEYKGGYVLDYQRLLEEQKVKPLTDEDKFEKMIENILENYDGYAKKPYFNEFGYVIYDFLANLGVINFTNEMKSEILENSKKLVLENMTEKKKSHSPGTSEHLQISGIMQRIKSDKKGGDSTVVLMCKNVGLCQYYDFILKNNISLKDEIQKSLQKKN